ncbi:MAG: two-component sensor histidine kinase, partial [Rugosibacter sp.]
MKRSLQRRLTLILGSAILLSSLIAAVASFILAYAEAKEFQDDILRQTALLATRNIGISVQMNMREKNRTKAALVTLGDSESRISVIRLPDDPRPVWLTGDLSSGFHTLEAGGEPLRLFVQR